MFELIVLCYILLCYILLCDISRWSNQTNQIDFFFIFFTFNFFVLAMINYYRELSMFFPFYFIHNFHYKVPYINFVFGCCCCCYWSIDWLTEWISHNQLMINWSFGCFWCCCCCFAFFSAICPRFCLFGNLKQTKKKVFVIMVGPQQKNDAFAKPKYPEIKQK